MTYKQLLKSVKSQLDTAGIYPAAGQLLLLEYCRRQAIDLYAEYNRSVPVTLQEDFLEGVQRLTAHEPLAYIIGTAPFYGYDFRVDPRVFIPRPETEELVERILDILDSGYFSADKEIKGLDIGTGSGAVAITLALEIPQVIMTACDISTAALTVATENAEVLGAKIDFVACDLFAGLAGRRYDFIVSNPPYIKDQELLEAEVKDHEPGIALFGGEKGQDFYRRILSQAATYLNPHNFLAFEIGYDQANDLKTLAAEFFPQAEVAVEQDINGKDRMLFIYNQK